VEVELNIHPCHRKGPGMHQAGYFQGALKGLRELSRHRLSEWLMFFLRWVANILVRTGSLEGQRLGTDSKTQSVCKDQWLLGALLVGVLIEILMEHSNYSKSIVQPHLPSSHPQWVAWKPTSNILHPNINISGEQSSSFVSRMFHMFHQFPPGMSRRCYLWKSRTMWRKVTRRATDPR